MTLYHEGSDGVQFDWIDIETTTTNIRCNIGTFYVFLFGSYVGSDDNTRRKISQEI